VDLLREERDSRRPKIQPGGYGRHVEIMESDDKDPGNVPVGIMVRRSITKPVNVVGMKFNAMHYSFSDNFHHSCH